MKLVVDMNLPPDWIPFFTGHGFDAVHWGNVGDPRAKDRQIMDWARANGHVVFSHDLDFGALLAMTRANGPSVVLAQETERDTNLGVYMLDALAQEMRVKAEVFENEYYLGFKLLPEGSKKPTGVKFEASPKQLLRALQVLSRNKGFRLPFLNTRQLGVKLAGESAVMEQSGWKRERGKTVRGVRFHEYEKSWE